MRPLLTIAAISGFSAVLFGALGAHLLSAYLTADGVRLYQLANLYHLVHSLALLGCAALIPFARRSERAMLFLKLAAGLFTLGIILFSGVLYYVAIFPGGQLHFLIPFGGLSFMLGWLMLAGVAFSPARKPGRK